MKKYTKLRNVRPKAQFGEAIAAAGIGAAATLASAAISSAATANAAKKQAAAQQAAAQVQADALKKQNENANKLQEKSIEFTAQQNEQNRDLQNQIQMNLQMLAGQQNENARLDAARIQVKKGGSPLKGQSSLLRGSYNMPFTVTDGGYAMPLGITPQGFGLYELRGDNHEQYHKTKGGKYKSGVGIKGATGQVVEGEGGKRNAQGELIMTTPDDIKFISKHSIKGFNPTQAVMNGMDPVDAYNTQEEIKAYNKYPKNKKGMKNGGSGIYIKPENRGKFTALQERTGKSATWFKENGTPAQRKMATFALNARKWNHGRDKYFVGGDSLLNLNPPDAINFSTDTIAPTVGGIGYILNNNEQAKCGGRMKRYIGGPGVAGITYPAGLYYSPLMQVATNAYNGNNNSADNKVGNSIINHTLNQTLPDNVRKNIFEGSRYPDETPKRLTSAQANYIGAGISGAANLLGAGITSIGNAIGARYSKEGARRANAALVDAYSKMHGIDTRLLDKKNYQAAHTMAALADVRPNLAPELTSIERSAQRNINAINKNSASAAAKLNRFAATEQAANDARSKIYGVGNDYSSKIRLANAQAINEAAEANAQRDMQANALRMRDMLGVLQYNNDIENSKIAGIGQANADLYNTVAGINSNRALSNAQTWANATTNTGNAFNKAFTQNATNLENRNNVLLGATMENQIATAIRDNDVDAMQRYYDLTAGSASDQIQAYRKTLENALRKAGKIK